MKNLHIVVRSEFGHKTVRNAVEAAHRVADGGELCQIIGGQAIGWDGAQYADAPESWVTAVAAVMATEGFKAKRAEMQRAADAEHATYMARNALQNAANHEIHRLDNAAKHYAARKDAAGLAAVKAEYEVFCATPESKTISHDFMAAHFAPAPAVFVPVEAEIILAIRAGIVMAEDIAAKIGAIGEDNVFIVQRKLGSMVQRKVLRQDRRGRFEVAQ